MAPDLLQSEEPVNFTEDNIGDFLLNVLTVGLYNRPDLIVREYVQNSHDAICGWSDKAESGRVDISVAWPNIHIFDNGPGMDRAELILAMSNLGKSFKTIAEGSGFMGIGKLAGTALASRVEIHSSKHGVPEKNWVAFNSAEMLAGIWERRSKGDYHSLPKTLKEHTRVNEVPVPEDVENHYTAVHLLDVREEYRQRIQDSDGFARSIGLLAPVAQDPGFEHAAEIEELLTVNIPDHYQPIGVYINGKPVYRPYETGLSRPKEIQVQAKDGSLLAYGWACLNTASERYKRQIAHEDLRGIALMQRGIAIGGRNLPEEIGLYSSVGNVIYFRWYSGELYIVDPSILVSTDRTRIRQSARTVEFIEQAASEFRKLARYAENWANRDNAVSVVQERVQTIGELEGQVKSGISRDRLPHILSELGEARSDIKKRKRHLSDGNVRTQADDAERRIDEILGQLIGAQESVASSEEHDDKGTLPLSEVVSSEIPMTAASVDDTETGRAVVLLDVPKRLGFSRRETRIYETTMEAISNVVGGRETDEFTKIATAVETAILDAFGCELEAE